MENKVRAKSNSNFQSLAGNNAPAKINEEYIEYRRCWEDNPKNFLLRELPLHLDIEASSFCNLRCTFCDKLPLLEKNMLGNMELAMFTHILDQFTETKKLWGLKLSYRGEPLMNQNVPKMVAYAKQKGVLDVYFNTNGMLLTEEVSRQLIEAHLDRISISIDGTDKEEFEKVRVGAKLETVLGNLQALRRLREEYGVEYPKIRIQTVYYQGMDLKHYVDTWEEYADEVAAVDYKDESVRKTGLVREDWACPQLWQRMTIEWDGSIFGCNNDDKRELYLGNAKERTIYDCWHDSRLQAAREAHKAGRSHCISACNGCPWRTAQIQKN